MPSVRQVSVRGGGALGGGLQVAQGLLQVQHVQQDAGQHQQQRQGQQAILQGSSISSVNETWVPYFFAS